MTIETENKKTLRPSMLVACGIDTYAKQIVVTPISRYGSGLYDANMRAGKRGITIKLMDLAGAGFALDGTHHPIRSTAEVDDGDATIVESYKGYVKYGIPAETPSNASGITQDIDFSVSGIPSGENKLTAHLRDSEGKTYHVTASAEASLKAKILAEHITPGARLYIDRITAGVSFQWDKSTLISCSLTLRGVDTKGDNPELQMSEVEIQGLIPDSADVSITAMEENSPIWYVAGYHDDVTPVRRFYLSEGVTVEKITATVKGYDATKFLEAKHLGVVSSFNHGKFCKGELAYHMLRRCYGILGRGLIYDHNAEFARTAVNEIDRKRSNDVNMRYMSANGQPRRSMVAAHCNLMRSPSGGLGNTAVYCDYVDAGLPTFRAGKKPIGETPFASQWDLDQGETSDFSEEQEVAIAEISAEIAWPKLEIGNKGKKKWTSFYAETIGQGESRIIETEEAYTGSKFKKYKSVVKENESGTKKWTHSKIGNLYRVPGHYYPDKKSRGHSAFQYRLKALKTEKQRLIGVRNVMTNPNSLPGLPSRATYEDGVLTYSTGRRGERVEFPQLFYATMVQAGTVSGKTPSNNKSLWGLFLKQIGERSNVLFTFTYRGNPRMQPRDIIHMNIGGQIVDMTVDNLTLEHKEGALTSTIVCRKGIL